MNVGEGILFNTLINNVEHSYDLYEYTVKNNISFIKGAWKKLVSIERV